MIHHLASLPWPWLIVAAVTIAVASRDIARWIRNEIELARRARAFRIAADVTERATSSTPTGSVQNPASAATSSSAASPLPDAAEGNFYPASRRL